MSRLAKFCSFGGHFNKRIHSSKSKVVSNEERPSEALLTTLKLVEKSLDAIPGLISALKGVLEIAKTLENLSSMEDAERIRSHAARILDLVIVPPNIEEPNSTGTLQTKIHKLTSDLEAFTVDYTKTVSTNVGPRDHITSVTNPNHIVGQAVPNLAVDNAPNAPIASVGVPIHEGVSEPSKQEIPCPKCNHISQGRANLCSHYKSSHEPEGGYQCSQCHQITKSSEGHDLHLKQCGESNSLPNDEFQYTAFMNTSRQYHADVISSIAVSPDGRYLASASWDETICLIDLYTNSLIQRIHRMNGIALVTFSPDGRWIAFGLWDNGVWVWEAQTDTHISMLGGHEDSVSCVAFSPIGDMLVSGSWDETIRVWSFPDGHHLATLTGHDDYVKSVGYSPDGTRIISGSSDSTIRFWDSTSFLPLLVIEAHTTLIHSLLICKNGDYLLSGSDDGSICRWDAHTGEAAGKGKVNTGSLIFIASEGAFAIVGDRFTGVLQLWNVSQGIQCIEDIRLDSTAFVSFAIFYGRTDGVLFGFADGSIEYWPFSKLISEVRDAKRDNPSSIAGAFRAHWDLVSRLDSKYNNSLLYHSHQFLSAIDCCKSSLPQLMIECHMLVDSSTPTTCWGSMASHYYGTLELLLQLNVAMKTASTLSQFDKLPDVTPA